MKDKNNIMEIIQQFDYRIADYFEYCGRNEPAVRSFEPLFAGNRASKCVKGSQR